MFYDKKYIQGPQRRHFLQILDYCGVFFQLIFERLLQYISYIYNIQIGLGSKYIHFIYLSIKIYNTISDKNRTKFKIGRKDKLSQEYYLFE